MYIPPSSSTNNEENTMLDGSNANEYDQLLPKVTMVQRKGKKRRVVGIILAILAAIAGIFLVVFIGITNFRIPGYKIDTYIVFLIGSAAFYIGIPLSSAYLIYRIIKNQRGQTSNGSTTQEYSSSHSINPTASTGSSTSGWYCSFQNLKRIWTNSARWQYFAALIVILFSSILDNAADFKEAFDEISNGTMTAFWPQKARTISRITSYTLNFFLVLFTLCWVLRTYNSFARENDKIRRWFTGNINDIETGIAAIKLYSENVLIKKTNWKENQTLQNANIFASIYVSCCLAWSFAYAYQVFTVQQTITIGAILNCVAHFLSYGSLVTIMWLTNRIIDEMKKTALRKMSFEHENTTIDLVSFKMFIKHYDPYASLFTKKTNLPGIVTTILPGFASLILPLIKSRFQS